MIPHVKYNYLFYFQHSMNGLCNEPTTVNMAGAPLRVFLYGSGL